MTEVSDPPPPLIEHLVSASLRIFGDGVDFAEVSGRLALTPTHTHLKGEKRHLRTATVYGQDMWQFEVPLDRKRPLDDHIAALWERIAWQADYLCELKQRLTVDVFLSYYSNWPDGGVVVMPENLEMFRVLGIPFSLSIIVSGSAGPSQS
jgi:hypothetical protein